MGYQDEIATWRVQRKQAEAANRVEQIREEHAQAVRERDQLIANNQMEEAEWRDMDVEQLEAEFNQYHPPQPQYHPKDMKMIRAAQPYFNRYGQRAAKAAFEVNQHITQRMRISPDHPNYEELMKRGMEFYAEKYGAPYDRNDEVLTPEEAAKISGLSPQGYAKAYQQLRRQGRVR
jgi:hypothetical protein